MPAPKAEERISLERLGLTFFHPPLFLFIILRYGFFNEMACRGGCSSMCTLRQHQCLRCTTARTRAHSAGQNSRSSTSPGSLQTRGWNRDGDTRHHCRPRHTLRLLYSQHNLQLHLLARHVMYVGEQQVQPRLLRHRGLQDGLCGAG